MTNIGNFSQIFLGLQDICGTKRLFVRSRDTDMGRHDDPVISIQGTHQATVCLRYHDIAIANQPKLFSCL